MEPLIIFCSNSASEKTTIHIHLPNIHTSLAEVKRRKLIDSGAIHLIGNFPLEAMGRWEEKAIILANKLSM